MFASVSENLSTFHMLGGREQCIYQIKVIFLSVNFGLCVLKAFRIDFGGRRELYFKKSCPSSQFLSGYFIWFELPFYVITFYIAVNYSGTSGCNHHS